MTQTEAKVGDQPTRWIRVLAWALVVFVLFEVNYPRLQPASGLAIFGALGLTLCFLTNEQLARSRAGRLVRWVAAALCVLVGVYLVVQTEPAFRSLWAQGSSLGDRAGAETGLDLLIGAIGLVLVVVAARLAVGWALPILALVFIAYAVVGPYLPSFLLPHRGYDFERIVSQTFLHSQGVYGTALRVMFSYVTLFVVFGALLQATGATKFIIGAAQRVFRKSVGGPAKVSVLSSGLMGSLSGSAVANTATTGTFTIPLMRSSGFKRHIAAGVEAAASSGGALVPPVMGAGAYMMLEIVQPPVVFSQIVRAAIWPALLYYLSLFLIVHFHSKRSLIKEPDADTAETLSSEPLRPFAGVLFFGALGVLIVLILEGFTVFRAVTVALGVLLVLSSFHPATRLTLARLDDALMRAARGAIPLVAAASSVGIVIGIVTLTGVGTKLPALIVPLAEESLILALLLIMTSSIILGLGLPSAVCYLLMATLIGPVLDDLGVVPLAAHLFIFYFGMMSMVTPPVALAAYTASSIAGAGMMKSGLAAFRFALAGFTLPYLFVFRPELLLLGDLGLSAFAVTLTVGALGIVALSAAVAGCLLQPLEVVPRGLLVAAAVLLLLPLGGSLVPFGNLSATNALGAAVLGAVWVLQWRGGRLEHAAG